MTTGGFLCFGLEFTRWRLRARAEPLSGGALSTIQWPTPTRVLSRVASISASASDADPCVAPRDDAYVVVALPLPV